uniref:Uncharacterized protein n=1 Tax=Panagrellus redivivus TaxID=6233 RepID=A0A7E4UPV3_PANRE
MRVEDRDRTTTTSFIGMSHEQRVWDLSDLDVITLSRACCCSIRFVCLTKVFRSRVSSSAAHPPVGYMKLSIPEASC